jgi:hypothetical protein
MSQNVYIGMTIKPWPILLDPYKGRRANAKVRSFIDLTIERLRQNPFIHTQE